MSHPRLPDFLLLGAPKCGTSALHATLARHPQLFLSDLKEPKFFLTDGPPPTSGGGPGDVPTWGEHVWRRDEYEALFAASPPGALCGESTVFYLYDRHAQRRIRALVPEARLVAVLRDPVERAHSTGHTFAAPAWNPRRTSSPPWTASPSGSPPGGRTFGTTPPRAATASSSSTCSRCSPASRCC